MKERVVRSEASSTHFNPKKQDESLFLSIKNDVIRKHIHMERCKGQMCQLDDKNYQGLSAVFD